MIEKVPMTPAGFASMKEELKRLTSVERPQITKEIEIARAHGDLSENAEYHAAREKQGMVEAKIRDIQNKLGRAEVIDVTKMRGDRVVFGSTVTLLDLDTDDELTYRIVGDDESDINKNLLSIQAPIARGLIGKREGEEVAIKTPGGSRELEILSVEYI